MVVKKNYQYTCTRCKVEYQIIDGVMCVNKFGFGKVDARKDQMCHNCVREVLDKPLPFVVK